MSKSWSWWVPICIGAIGALSACDDDHGDAKQVSLVVETSGCPGEEAQLFVDDESVYSGPVTGLASATLHVDAGDHHVVLWIEGETYYDAQVSAANDTLTINAPRTVECPGGSLDGGPGGEDGGETDAGETDAGETDAGTVTLLEPCSADDNTADAAQRIVSGTYEDALCGAGDVDYFAFTVGAQPLTEVTLSIAGLESALAGELSLYDDEGTELEVQTDEGEDAVIHFSLLGSRSYVLRVADVSGAEDPDGGVPTNPYKLSLAFAADTATVEASAGTFHGANNNEDDDAPPELEGSYVATSVHVADNQPVTYKVLASVTLPGAEAQRFVYDPSILADDVLRIVFYDGVEPVIAPLSSRATFKRFNGWLARPVVRKHGGLQLIDAFDGDVVIEFPSQTFTRTVDAGAMLAVPTVTSATPSGDPTTLAVALAAPANATQYAASAFGSGDSAAHGNTTSSDASFDIALDGTLEADEAFVIRVQATDNAFLKLPLPETSNLSEFLYYSDQSAQQE